MRRRVSKGSSLLKESRNIQSRNSPVRERPGRTHLPCTFAGELAGRGRKYKIRSDSPAEASLLFVRPRHHEQVQKLEVVERGSSCRAFVAWNRYDLDRRTDKLLERREQLWPHRQQRPKLQRVRLRIRAIFGRIVDVLDLELSQRRGRVVLLLGQPFLREICRRALLGDSYRTPRQQD